VRYSNKIYLLNSIFFIEYLQKNQEDGSSTNVNKEKSFSISSKKKYCL
jgi:hypothetical protein